MKKLLSKTMAFAMAGALLCSSITVSAATGTQEETTSGATGNTTGSSTVEGYVNPDVFTVVLPTDDATNPTFNFKLDPQKLLHATQGSTYSDADATVIFDTKTNTSNELKVQNKGNVVVDATITAEVKDLTDSDISPTYTIPLVADNTFVGDTTTSLYLGLTVGDKPTVALDNDTKKAEATYRLDGVAEENFEITGTTGSYAKVLKSSVTDADFPSTTFSLTGACNANADWTDATGATPEVTVTWTLTEVTDFAPAAPAEFTYLKGSAAAIPVDLGKGTLAASKIKSVTASNTQTGTYSAAAGLVAKGSSVSIDSSMWTAAKPGDKRYVKVAFDDADNTSAIIEITIATATAPSAPATFVYSKGSAATIPVDLGLGDLAASKITSVTAANTSTGSYATVNGLAAKDASITLGSSLWNAAVAGDKRYVKVVFDDAAATTVVIEISIQ